MRKFDAPAHIAYVNALFIIGTLGTLISPAMLEAWSGHLQWSQIHLGVVAAIELATLGLGALTGLYWQRRWDWRIVSLAAIALGAAGNVACVVFTDFYVVCIARAAAGAAGGLLCAVYSAFLANTHSPGRNIAITTFVQIGVEAVFMFSTASVLATLGWMGLFILMAALFACLVPFMGFLPRRWPETETVSSEMTQEGRRGAYPILLSFLPFISFQAGVYTFLGDFGHMAASLDLTQTLHALGVSVVFSALGSVAAYFLDDRIGFRVPVGGAILVLIVMFIAMIFGSKSASLFVLYVSVLQIGWIFLNCYLYCALIAADNLLVPAATPISSLGSAIGAGSMGYVLEHRGLPGALWLSIALLVVTAVLSLPFIARHTSPTPTPCRSGEA